VIDIIRELQEYGITVQIHDPLADPIEVELEYGLGLVPFEELKPAAAVVMAVAHKKYREMSVDHFKGLMTGSVLIDVKGIFQAAEIEAAGIRFWRL
jgi:UDP-N-acetyl-D-galactosamine dehydrogenase